MTKKMENVIKPSTNSSNLLKNIIELGKATKDVSISDIKFSLVSLTEKESNNLFSNIMMLDEQTRVVYTKSYAVAASISKIDGVDFEQLIDSYSEIPEDLFDNVFMKKVFIVSLLQAEIVNKLFEEYSNLNKNILEVGKEEVKKS